MPVSRTFRIPSQTLNFFRSALLVVVVDPEVAPLPAQGYLGQIVFLLTTVVINQQGLLIRLMHLRGTSEMSEKRRQKAVGVPRDSTTM